MKQQKTKEKEKNEEKNTNRPKDDKKSSKQSINEKIQSSKTLKDNKNKEEKINIIKDKENHEKESSITKDIKLISVEFVNDNDKFIEEFIQLKKLAKLKKEKISLPLITPKIPIDKNSSANDENKDFEFEKKFQLRGLVHEKEEFLHNSSKNSLTRHSGTHLIKRKNTNPDSESHFNRNYNKFDNRNYTNRNNFYGRVRGRTWKFNNQ